jgi:hypothetical protein
MQKDVNFVQLRWCRMWSLVLRRLFRIARPKEFGLVYYPHKPATAAINSTVHPVPTVVFG